MVVLDFDIRMVRFYKKERRIMCMDQLAEKLAALFKEADPSRIDEAVAKARSQLTAEATQAKQDGFERLFDAQIATLKDRNVPDQIVELFVSQKGDVLRKAGEMVIADGNIPFLPVIPRSYRSSYDLMAMVKNGTKVGYTYLYPDEISDTVETPNKPYYVYDVENGQATRGKSPRDAEEILKRQLRSPLTAAEVMALCTHTDVLSRHYVLASGSRCKSAGSVPLACLNFGDRPELDWYYVGHAAEQWGSASCGSR